MMTTTPQDWHAAKELIGRALELEPQARGAFLDKACHGRPAVRKLVDTLLADAEKMPPDFLDSPVTAAATRLLSGIQAPAKAGQAIGPYRLLKFIAIGGQAAVYLAERSDQAYQKQVAIKIIQEGPVAGRARRRFQREWQTLANLNHPGIARFIDANVTDSGLPYLVMEYIEGQPIVAYCEAHGLGLGDRIALFRQVCGAVNYAHQNLVVHCDIKPANILITPDGLAKLLDFGIARLLRREGPAGPSQPLTTTLRFVTPRYASPEQIRNQPITTASDVYSLGVILYELLTGRHPYPSNGGSPGELERLICEREPTRPSMAVGRGRSDADAAERDSRPGVTAVRRDGNGDGVRLSRRLRGDLDNIILTAMHKEPPRRYGSAEQFSEDLRRYLAGLPVQAHRDTLHYRTAKFIRRNKLGVVAAAMVVLALTGGIIGTAIGMTRSQAEARRAKSEAHKAEQVVAFLRQTLMSIDPEQTGREVTVRRILSNASQRVRKELLLRHRSSEHI